MESDIKAYWYAVEDFHEARREALFEEFFARIVGKSTDLISYDRIREKLGAVEQTGKKEKRNIPLNAIIGSVGRYSDFTRSFLPKKDSDKDRWTRIMLAVEGNEKMPPIEVYQIGEKYFVLDGHHRISVARKMGKKEIFANVTLVDTQYSLKDDDIPDEIILEQERKDFLEKTGFSHLYPVKDICITAPGQYKVLLEHIDVHRYYMGIEQKKPISYQDAVKDWYEKVYSPVIMIIRDWNILREFPGRTEADLYLWILDHRSSLEKELGWDIAPDDAAKDLARRYGKMPLQKIKRWWQRVRNAFVPDDIPGEFDQRGWIRQQANCEHEKYLFDHIMIAMGENDIDSAAFIQALNLAKKEGAWLAGLHVVDEENKINSDLAHKMRDRFEKKCREVGVTGKLVVEVGKPAQKISLRSKWTDLVVLKIVYPPPIKFFKKFTHGFRSIIQNCSSPILAVPDSSYEKPDKILLAFDGSPKSKRALYVATYLAGCWDARLIVVTAVKEGNEFFEEINFAKRYLENHEIIHDYRIHKGFPSSLILNTIRDTGVNLIVMGGYGGGIIKEALFSSTVDLVLRNAEIPVLICK